MRPVFTLPLSICAIDPDGMQAGIGCAAYIKVWIIADMHDLLRCALELLASNVEQRRVGFGGAVLMCGHRGME